MAGWMARGALRGLQGAGIGGALGGLTGGIGSAFDGEDDAFSDTIKGFGMGAVGGALSGGMGSVGSGLIKQGGKKALLGRGLMGGSLVAGFGGLTSPLGNSLDAGDEQEDATAPKEVGPGVLATAAQARGGMSLGLQDPLQSMPGFLSAQGESAPDISLPSMAALTLDPDVQKAANAQIIGANAATMREIKGIKKRRDIELQQNENLSGEFQRRADEIQGGNVASTKAISDHHAARQAAVDAETDAMHEGTGAALAGNEYTRAQHAGEMDETTTRLNEARVADNALLERLGLGTQTILQDLASAEQANTQNDMQNIRAEAADEIDGKNTETADRWRFDKPQILNSLAQDQQKSILQQRQMGLQMYQTKLQDAGSRRQDMLSYLNAQNSVNAQMYGSAMKAQGQTAEGPIPATQLYGSSGQTFKSPIDDSTQNVPFYATLDPALLAQYYPHLVQSAQQWMDATGAASE